MGAVAANNAWGELSVGVLPTSTQILLSGGQGDRFPNATLNVSWFFATLADKSNNLEVVKCTARLGDTLTVQRGVDGTTPRAYAQGDRLELRPCAALFNDKVSEDALASKAEEINTAWKAGDESVIARYDAELDDIRGTYAKTTYVDTKIKEVTSDSGSLYLKSEDAKKTYFPYEGGTLTGSVLIKGEKGEGLTITGGDLVVKSAYANEIMRGGSITASGAIKGGTVSADSLTATSDERLKKNIEEFGPGAGLSLIDYIRPVWFNWKKDDRRDDGVIAQELLSVLPNAVFVDDDGRFSVNYSALIPVLLSAVRDLKNEVEELKKCRE